MGEPALADKLGRQGHDYFQENYAWDRIVEKYERLLEMATRRRGGCRG
jgi:glycosyltransferase involved in cell wall biosynthesis